MDSNDIAAPKILRDVGGVPGVHVLLEAFSEETERSLFHSSGFFKEGKNTDPGSKGHRGWNTSSSEPTFPADEVYKLSNRVKDSGLCPGLVYPNCVYALSYQPLEVLEERTAKGKPKKKKCVGGPKFAAHLDSRYKWGETVMGEFLFIVVWAYITFTKVLVK